MTAQTILNNILNTINLLKPNASLAGNDIDITQIKSFMNDAGSEIASRARWQELVKIIFTGGGVSSFALPVDFQQLSVGGAVVLNESTYRPCRIVTCDSLWQLLSVQNSGVTYFKLEQNKILFAPVLNGNGAKIQYYSKYWANGTSDQINQNADISLLPENLIAKGAIYRWYREKGLPYEDQLAEFEAMMATENNASNGLL